MILSMYALSKRRMVLSISGIVLSMRGYGTLNERYGNSMPGMVLSIRGMVLSMRGYDTLNKRYGTLNERYMVTQCQVWFSQ